MEENVLIARVQMLTRRELARFSEDYTLAAPDIGGMRSESGQRHKIGNIVCSPDAKALVAANYCPRRSMADRESQNWLFENAA